MTGSPSSISSTNEYLLLSSESGTVAVLKVTEEGVKVQAEVANADTSCLFMADDSPMLSTLSSKKVASDMTYARENVQCTWRLILYIVYLQLSLTDVTTGKTKGSPMQMELGDHHGKPIHVMLTIDIIVHQFFVIICWFKLRVHLLTAVGVASSIEERKRRSADVGSVGG